ncbi:MAG TPA: exodeoxyribonuclease VII large subunit [Marmoricola sp.]|nr:exodeoxyribonuclease VII large subunit [Marmoricola sp.]
MSLQTSPEQPAQVRTIARAIGTWIDRLGVVWVEGQVTQISRRQGMATVFLTLRDKLADVSIQVTAPRGVVDSLATPLVEGASIVVQGKPAYYENRGTLSLAAREIRLVGLGELLARIDRRRQLLAAEGLFDIALKRRLPFLPNAVGLITAHNSAAERDVVEVAQRRWPGVRFEIKYAAMQGVNATREVVEALQRLDADSEVQVIVIARGGGSVEDLLPFSDETLIRAVHAARTPVVSAIGHESDSPLLDLVADVRAATPTDAAKRVVPDVAEESARITNAADRLRRAVRIQLTNQQSRLDALRARPVLADPRASLDRADTEVAALRERATWALRRQIDRAGEDLDHRRARVQALSPQATLARGYAIAVRSDGSLITTTADVGLDEQIDLRVTDGRLGVTVTRKDTP